MTRVKGKERGDQSNHEEISIVYENGVEKKVKEKRLRYQFQPVTRGGEKRGQGGGRFDVGNMGRSHLIWAL